ncbi:MFS transporter [Streptomyces sp. AV19]|uniref:MFS transporter n=1 Tax=Streptomyces sp. AV19 TaxID=2793068 RepID=UPI0018FE249A|nr:MFS transporter [Streptomyces sp. AV19]MBH1937316.1 MFS transporter [Streptomyces sp. AV19]MDG4536794.1 MFS transporter [Streptomyces sp. AV19]
MQRGRGRTRAVLAVPDFRLYLAGQGLSLVGTWMQAVAQPWLVLELSHSGTVVGLATAALFLPVLLLGPYGGLVADRADKRRLLLLTQAAFMLLALALGLLTVTGAVRLWHVFVIAVLMGTVNAVDMPARQTFVPELVGHALIRDAVSINSVMNSATRAIGPAVAGILIAMAGAGVCFLANAVSFVAVLGSLALMRADRLRPTPPVPREPGQVREGLRYVRGEAGLWGPLLMLALIGTLAYEFQVVLPLLAVDELHGDSRTYGYMTSAMALGAVAGGVAVTARGRAGVLPLTVAAGGFGVTILAASLVPTLGTELVALPFVGAAGTLFLATVNTTLQMTSQPRFRGRVMALWSVMFLGSTPVGGPVVGVVTDVLGARAALALGAVACALAVVVGLAVLPRLSPGERVLPHPTSEGAPGPEPP